jgi:arylsulfatase A-like enzyme
VDVITRRDWIGGLGAAALAARAQNGRRPNILYVMLDDAGTADFGCYGQRRILTPAVDRLATEGMRFTAAYAGGSVCAPSRSCLMTGLHQGHAPVRANAGTVPILASDFTLAQMLQQAGYRTGGYGKWGLGDVGSTGVPEKHGFDEFFGYYHQIHAHDYFTPFLWRNSQKVPLKKGDYSAYVIHDRAMQFLRAQTPDHPFFLYATYTLPHAKHEIPTVAPYEGRDWPQAEKIYAAMITLADKQTGELLALLHDKGMDDNTVVIFTSDNGGTGGEEGSAHKLSFFDSNAGLRGQKAQLYEGGIRAPFIVRWPGKVKPGATSDLPFAFWDVMPTLAEITGAKAPKSDGMSIVPTLLGKPQNRERLLYWEQYKFDRKKNDLILDTLACAGRFGDWKIVRPHAGAPLELYNLKTDPGEKHDLAGANAAVVRKLEPMLQAAHQPPRTHSTGSFEFVE